MGHPAGKDIHGEPGGKSDDPSVRAPRNGHFRQILKELYTVEKALISDTLRSKIPDKVREAVE